MRLRYFLVLAAVGLFVWPAHAVAQALPDNNESAFIFGPIEWTPALAFRDAGIDSNIFDTPLEHRSDVTWTLTPAVAVRLETPRVKVQGGSVFDIVYFNQYESERSLNRSFSGRVEVPLKLFTPYVGSAYEHVRDRENGELDVRATRAGTTLQLGASANVASRATLRLGASVQDAEYDDGQTVRGVVLSDSLNRRVDSLLAGVTFQLTPLTSFVVDGGMSRALYRLATDKDQRDTRGSVGFEFSPDAVIRGRASLGYHSLTTGDRRNQPFTGLTADVDLSYVLLGVTRFDGRFVRDTTHSIEEAYYLRTIAGLSVVQTFLGPVDLTGHATRERMTYVSIDRTDHTDSLGGGVAVRLSRLTRLKFDYELIQRQSPIELLRYQRRRIFTSVVVGF